MNPQGLKLIGAEDLQSVMLADVYEIVEESHREKFKNFNKKVCSGIKGHLEFEIISLDGTRRCMETYAAPYELSNGELAHIAITNDITEKVYSEKIILEQKQALENSSRLATLGQFVSGIAHEINNPLFIITAQANLILSKSRKDSLSKEDLEVRINKIDETVSNITKIIKGLRKFSRDSDGESKENINLKNIVNETMELCEGHFNAKGIDIRTSIDSGLIIFADPIQISQVLMNVLNNSYDAVLNGDEKWIDISAEETPSQIIIKVTDSGEKISKDVVNNIFNPFFTTKEIGKGTGLGLSISLGIMQSHNGNMIYNEKAKNTQFILTFPKVS